MLPIEIFYFALKLNSNRSASPLRVETGCWVSSVVSEFKNNSSEHFFEGHRATGHSPAQAAACLGCLVSLLGWHGLRLAAQAKAAALVSIYHSVRRSWCKSAKVCTKLQTSEGMLFLDESCETADWI